ncbi:porin [Myroides phaeus]|uniref:Phosphate-selective porin O and P n=1 Tax=Myroides phaeus TaxID=702745 RepID=A0A1G8DAF3_9FLAO|nr:porin [Myroides phaeus]MEC4117499.1 porin [Myroides phaeus]SDH54671.1 Phosphate-selective porin O and P [Myroides phaeus]
MVNLYNTLKLKVLVGAAVCCTAVSFAQKVETDTVAVFEEKIVLNPVDEKFPKFKVGGVFQSRFSANFKENVDIDGLHHSDGSGTHNTFDVKRMRVSMGVKVTKNLEVTALANFADFKQKDVSTRVLENAFAKYTVNRYLQITVGQFRPLFGMEETMPVDVLRSIDYTNSYYTFGRLGWTSFQVGAAITGSVDLGDVPMSYGFSVTNGNGKNKTDNDDGKNYSSRLLFNLDKKHNLNVGVSGGIAEVNKEKAYAVGVEATAKLPITERWSIDFQTEAKQATNHEQYFKALNASIVDGVPTLTSKIDDYKVKSFYFVPNIRYEIGAKTFHAIEFACRYEYLDENSTLNSNARQTWIPMLTLEVLKNYGVRIQAGMQIDNFKHNIENSKTYNSNLAFLQLQCRFL